MVLVVTSFVAALGYSQYLVTQIDRRALHIMEDGVPRFVHLHEARSALAQASTLADDYIFRSSTKTGQMYAELSSLMAQVRSELAAYHADSPEEQRQLNLLHREVMQLDAAIRRACEQVDAGDPDSAVALFKEKSRPLETEINRTLVEMRGLSLDRIKADSERIIGMRHSGVEAATTLGLLSLGLAIAATALVLQGQKARARLMAERDRLLTEQAAELESFAGRVAHDLRDPLSAASLRLAALQQTHRLNERASAYVDQSQGQLERMRRVIEGLLEFARSGARPVPGARANVAAVLDEVLTSLRPAAEAVHADLNVGPIADVQLALPPQALSSVLSNLLSNAVKYVVEGRQLPHQIGVRVTRRARLARIEVEDNGPGLPPGTEERVFEPFRRLPSKQTGTGLGLATVKRIVEAYAGRVGVDTEAGRGSTFWVEIPYYEPPPR
jgi:signal transduction histidine kinase